MLNDPMFYVELTGRCMRESARCDSKMAVIGLRKLAQGYLDIAEALHQKTKEASAQA